MTLLFHWIIAYCKTTKRIGTLNFTNMNLPFVVINLIVCLSIAGHTTQGYTGSGMLCTTYLALGVPLGNRYLNYWIDVVASADDKISCQIVVCLWGKAHMGSAYDFDLLMYFLALRIGTRCVPVISLWVYPPYSQR